MTGHPKELIAWLLEQPEDKVFEAKEKRGRRSLTANAYYWVLANKLGRALGVSDSEVHGQMLRQYGVCDVFSVVEGVPIHDYFRYFDVFAHGRMNGRTYAHVRAYKGSSQMDSKEFSRLLEGIRWECEQQGIDVMTPAEVASLEYAEAYGKE